MAIGKAGPFAVRGLPRDMLRELNRFFKLRLLQRDPELAAERLWKWSRTTAWRLVKEVMAAAGGIVAPAMPRGLRHSFGVKAFQSNVPPHLVQRWMGHASLRSARLQSMPTWWGRTSAHSPRPCGGRGSKRLQVIECADGRPHQGR